MNRVIKFNKILSFQAKNLTVIPSINMINSSRNASTFNKFPTQTYVNGKWCDSVEAKSFQVFDPANNKLLGSVPDCGANDVNQAVDAAAEAFKVWSNYTAEQRSKLLKQLVEVHREHKQALAEIITFENGKPLADALVEIETSIKAYEWFAEEAKRTYGDMIPAPVANKRFLVVKQPIGVCGFLTPWNFPSSMLARKASAALASGCTFVAKPSEDTPYSALALASMADMAGLPAGCVNILTTSKQNTPIVGKALCEHPVVKKIGFTGSTGVGKLILANCASTVKKCQMELGGNAPFIIFDSADIKKAVAGVIGCKFRCSGQTCICANRILVQENIHDDFVAAMKTAMTEQLCVGNGFDKKTTQGPLISQNSVDKVHRLVEDSRAKGGQVVLGGKSTGDKGFFYEPTLITDINLNMEISTEEIFGPVAAITKFKTEEEAISIANACDVGLAGYFYSQDPSQIWRVSEKLEVGMVGVNEAAISTIEAPFGGVKQSGFGYEGSKYGIDEYMNNKFVCMGI